MAYVYRHIRLDKNEVFYIGIGEYKNRATNTTGRNRHWKSIVNKSAYEVEILFEDLTWDEACKKEAEFILLYGRKDLGRGTLVNLTHGGDGAKGVIFTPARIEAMRQRELGRKHSEETKRKQSEMRKGRPIHSVESKEIRRQRAIGNKFGKGRVVSEASREKARQSMKGKPRPNMVGHFVSEETRAKIAAANRRRGGHSEETKRRISEANKGKIRTDEMREKWRITSTGRKMSPESTAKRLASRGEWKMSDEQKKKLSEWRTGRKFGKRAPYNYKNKPNVQSKLQ